MVWDATSARLVIRLAFPEGHPRFGTFSDADMKDGKGPEWPNKADVGGAALSVDIDPDDQPIGDDPRDLWFHTDPNDNNVRLVFRADCRQVRRADIWMFAEIEEESAESRASSRRSTMGWSFMLVNPRESAAESSVGDSTQ